MMSRRTSHTLIYVAICTMLAKVTHTNDVRVAGANVDDTLDNPWPRRASSAPSSSSASVEQASEDVNGGPSQMSASPRRVLLLTHHIGSHTAEFSAIGRALSKGYGYEIYVAVPDNYSKRRQMESAGFHLLQYTLPDGLMRADSAEFREWLTEAVFSGRSQVELHEDVGRYTMEECAHMMRDSGFLDAVRDLNFSIAVYDGYILTSCWVILPHYLGIPHVYEFSELPSLLPGLRLSPAFIPAAIADHFEHSMTLLERASNLMLHLIEGYGLVSAVRNTSLIQKYGRGASLSWSDIMTESELFLVTRDHMLEWPLPALPNVITLPGITYSPPQPLPGDLDVIMKGAETVVLVTMGSMAHIDHFPASILTRMLQGFSIVPAGVTFLMQYPRSASFSDRYDVPENLLVFDWLPQNDILGHPKTRAFVTHCGNNGQYESLYHGVPMVGMPLFAEQPGNCYRIQHHGLGICLDTSRFHAADMAEAIQNVLDSESFPFANNTRKRAIILRSRPMHAADEAAFWINHVDQYGGDHLRSPATAMPAYQLYMLDVLGLFVTIPIAMATIVCCVVRAIFRRCRKSKLKES